MATLSDLFVSYKSVEPEKQVSSTAQPTFSELVNLQAARGRLQQIEENEAAQNPEENQPIVSDENPDDFSDLDELFDTDPDWDADSFSWLSEPFGESHTLATSQKREELFPPYKPASEFTPTGTVVRYSRGNLAAEIKDLFDKAGINITVTSGQRPAGKAGKAGNRSHHVKGNAVDIVPGKGETFASIREKMTSHPEILQFFYENGLGVIDETNPTTMAKTGATGKHFHIGPDKWATRTWAQWTGTTLPYPTLPTGNQQQEWTRNLYNAYAKGLKDEYGNKYNNATYNRIAAYMTYQSALESGYGQHANGFNYGGHMRNGKTIHYDTLNEFVKAQIKTLKKWDVMKADSLRDYVNSLYKGPYLYNASDSPDKYYASINGTVQRVNRYLGLSAKFGGKFTTVRQLYEQSFSHNR